ncbi:MAG: ATP-binding cassette domain-containing protein [Syntrophales bacterium]|nr:ATP-binding cassette domain-containing protein [Syntrophales bacterium]
MTVVIGPSGSGKTTLMRIIAGLDKPDSGIIRFGEEVWTDTKRRICLPPQKRRLGYVFQDYTLFPHLTLYENAAFAAKKKEDVHSLLERFGLWHLRHRKPHAVSGGERQRCAICQALAGRPRLLLLDEPFSALDAFTRRDLRCELQKIKSEFSIPIIYVTHDLNAALYLADSLLPLVEGKVDRDWMQRSISPADHPQGETAKSVREPRLSLAY